MEQIPWAASIAAQALLAARLLFQGGWRRLPWFTAFLIAGLARSAVLLQAPPRTMTYFYWFSFGELLLMPLLLASAWEVLRQLRRRYGPFGPWWAVWLAGLALLLLAVLLAIASVQVNSEWAYLRLVAVSGRRWVSAVVFCCLTAAWAVTRFYGTDDHAAWLTRQRGFLIAYAALYSVAVVAFDAAGRSLAPAINQAMLAGTAALYCLWAVALSPAAFAHMPPGRATAGDLEAMAGRWEQALRRAVSAPRPPGE